MPICICRRTGSTCCKAVRVVLGKYENMSLEKPGGREKEKRWDTGTCTDPWLEVCRRQLCSILD